MVSDLSGFVGEDGKLNTDALCEEILKWFKIQTAKIEADKAAEGKKDG
jgi:hypothetical protein